MIADALKVNHSLVTLDLSSNNIGDDGAKMIADAVNVNRSLKELYLDRNNIHRDHYIHRDHNTIIIIIFLNYHLLYIERTTNRNKIIV